MQIKMQVKIKAGEKVGAKFRGNEKRGIVCRQILLRRRT
jgi:hypothetical protein